MSGEKTHRCDIDMTLSCHVVCIRNITLYHYKYMHRHHVAGMQSLFLSPHTHNLINRQQLLCPVSVMSYGGNNEFIGLLPATSKVNNVSQVFVLFVFLCRSSLSSHRLLPPPCGRFW